jgi:NADH-quinone oxidoreductase subunit F
MATCGLAAGSQAVYDIFVQETKKHNLNVKIDRCGCIGACYAEPIIEVVVPGENPVKYCNVDAKRAQEIFDSHLLKKELLTDAVYHPEGEARQQKVVLRNCGIVDPESIEDYISYDGTRALPRSLPTMRRNR